MHVHCRRVCDTDAQLKSSMSMMNGSKYEIMRICLRFHLDSD